MAYTKIMPRRGTKYEWTTLNPVLYEGEMAVECPDSGIGTGLCKFKFGDGFRTYKELPYAFDGASASSMNGGGAFSSNTIQIRSDTHDNWITANPILAENELAYDKDYNCFYMGDGKTLFADLIPAGRQIVYDFGDEDAEEEATATLADMLSSVDLENQTKFVLENTVPLANEEESSDDSQSNEEFISYSNNGADSESLEDSSTDDYSSKSNLYGSAPEIINDPYDEG